MTDHVTPIRKNVLPADEWGDICEKEKELKLRKAELKQLFIENRASRSGERYRIKVANHSHGNILYDIKALKREFGEAKIREFTYRSEPYYAVIVVKK